MIITLQIKLAFNAYDEDSSWGLKVEILDTFSLLELHYLIQKEIGFDNDHMFEFFVAKNINSRKRTPIYQNDFDAEFTDTLEAYSKINILSIIEEKGLKFFYLFDYGDCWEFEIKASKKLADINPSIFYPNVLHKSPNVIEQYPDYKD